MRRGQYCGYRNSVKDFFELLAGYGQCEIEFAYRTGTLQVFSLKIVAASVFRR